METNTQTCVYIYVKIYKLCIRLEIKIQKGNISTRRGKNVIGD